MIIQQTIENDNIIEAKKNIINRKRRYTIIE